MALKWLTSQKDREKKNKQKETKDKHKGKTWATLNTNDKFEIIGDDLIARGVIDG